MMNAAVFCRAVEDKLQRKLDVIELTSIKDYLAGIYIDKHTSLKLAFKYHLEQVIRVLQHRKPDGDLVDIKEYQVETIGTTAEDAQLSKKTKQPPDDTDMLIAEIAKVEALFLIEMAEVYDLSKAIAPRSKLKYNYLMLDSNNCFDIPSSRDKFTWLLQEKIPRLQRGYINLHSVMRNIVMARIGRVTMSHMHGDFAVAALARNRFGFGFEEFASQALITPFGNKFQFITFLPEYDTNYGTTVVLSPFNANRGWFRFRERFKTLDKLTLTIYNLNTNAKVQVPATYFSFPASLLRGFSTSLGGIAATNPISIPNSRIYLPINYVYVPPSFVYNREASVQGEYNFTGISTGDPAIDAAWTAPPTSGLQWRFNDYYYPVPALPLPVIGTYNFTITLTELPRFTCVLELISEDDSDDDTPI